MSAHNRLSKKDIFSFKQTSVVCGDILIYYNLIGFNLLFIHDTVDETVHVMDDELDSFEHSVIMCESEFFESYAGYHMGTDDVTIEDLIKQEYIMQVDCQSDVRSSARNMKQLEKEFKPVSFKQISYKNFN